MINHSYGRSTRRALRIAALSALFGGFMQISAATYFISSHSGNDANNGLSAQSPWKSLEKIYIKSYSTAPFQPGDQILLNRGEVWDGQIRLHAVGTSAKPVVLGAYGTGVAPLIYGDNHSVTWVAVSGYPGIYQAYVGKGSIVSEAYDGSAHLTAVSAVAAGNHILNVALAADLKTYLDMLSPGSFGPPTATDTLWVRTSTGGAPTKVRAYRTAAVYVENSHYVTVQGLSIKNTNEGVDVSGSSNVAVTGNSIQSTLGIGIYLRGSDINCSVEANLLSTTGNDALYVLSGTDNIFSSNTITNVTDTVLGLPTVGDHAAIGLQQSVNTLVEHNSISSVKGSGVDYYYESGSTVRYNYLFDVGGGIFPHGTNLSVYYNIINARWRYYGQAGHDGIHATNTGTGTILVYNNVIYAINDFGLMGSGTGKIHFRNNLVYSANPVGTLLSTGANTDSDFNCFYTSGVPIFVNGSGTYQGLTAFSRAVGDEQHSVFGDPRFAVSTPVAANDFHLSTLSPCLAAGVDLKVIGLIGLSAEYLDYAGVSVPKGLQPSIGAFE